MLTIGLAMLTGVTVMLTIARPRNETPAGWLQTESHQQIYGFTMALLLTVGSQLALDGSAR